MPEQTPNPKAQEPGKKYKIALSVSTGLMLAALICAFILLFVFRADASRQRDEAVLSQTVTVASGLKQEDRHLAINQRIVFENAGAKGNLGIKNSNQKQENILVEIYDTASGQLVYRSYRIPNGFEIAQDSLSVQLEKGTYPCVAYFEFLDAQDQVTEIIGTDVVIEVLN